MYQDLKIKDTKALKILILLYAQRHVHYLIHKNCTLALKISCSSRLSHGR